jgi:hypothetical protein
MEDMGWMVHAFLKGTVKVRKSFCATSKTKVLAEIVAALGAIITVIAHDASLDSDSLTRY